MEDRYLDGLLPGRTHTLGRRRAAGARGLRLPGPRTLFARFTLLSLATTLAIAAFSVWAMERQVEHYVLGATEHDLARLADTFLDVPLRAGDRGAFDQTAAQLRQFDGLSSIAVYGSNGLRLGEPDEDGATLTADRLEALRVGATATRWLPDERLAAFVPAHLIDGTPAVYQFVKDGRALLAHIAEMQTFIAVAVLGGFATLYGALFALIRASSARLEQLVAALSRRHAQLAALVEVVQRAAGTLREEELLCWGAEEATRLAGMQIAGILLPDETGVALRLKATWGMPAELEAQLGALTFCPDDGVPGRVFASGEVLVIRDPATDPLVSQPLRELGVRTYVCLPLHASRGLVGVMGLLSREPVPLSEEDLRVLRTLADALGLAIERSALIAELGQAEAARELARLKDEFLDTVSHELRTPLSLVTGYAELLKARHAQLDDTARAAMIDQLDAGASQMLRLVEDLLDFSRIEGGRLALEIKTLDLAQLIQGVVEGFRLQPGGDVLQVEVPVRLPVVADPDRLRQVVGNLVSNALRYAPGKPIRVRAGRAQDGVWFELADHGPGIAPEEQARVWERFYRAEHASMASARGLGIGLAVVRALAEAHGGRVLLNSQPGRGSRFRVTLPVPAGVPAQAA